MDKPYLSKQATELANHAGSQIIEGQSSVVISYHSGHIGYRSIIHTAPRTLDYTIEYHDNGLVTFETKSPETSIRPLETSSEDPNIRMPINPSGNKVIADPSDVKELLNDLEDKGFYELWNYIGDPLSHNLETQRLRIHGEKPHEVEVHEPEEFPDEISAIVERLCEPFAGKIALLREE